MKGIVFIFFLGVLLSTPLLAQYHGGEGDGFASTDLIIERGAENQPLFRLLPNLITEGQWATIDILADTTNQTEPILMELYDIQGRLLWAADFSTAPLLQKKISELIGGFYLLYFKQGSIRQTEKLVVVAER